MTAGAAHLGRTAKPGSLASPFARHGLALGGGAIAAYLLASQLPAAEQPLVWLASAVVAGAAGALIGRGWLGLLFVLLGLVTGLAVELHLRIGSGSAAAIELQSSGATYLAALACLTLAYLITMTIVASLGAAVARVSPPG